MVARLAYAKVRYIVWLYVCGVVRTGNTAVTILYFSERNRRLGFGSIDVNAITRDFGGLLFV